MSAPRGRLPRRGHRGAQRTPLLSGGGPDGVHPAHMPCPGQLAHRLPPADRRLRRRVPSAPAARPAPRRPATTGTRHHGMRVARDAVAAGRVPSDLIDEALEHAERATTSSATSSAACCRRSSSTAASVRASSRWPPTSGCFPVNPTASAWPRWKRGRRRGPGGRPTGADHSDRAATSGRAAPRLRAASGDRGGRERGLDRRRRRDDRSGRRGEVQAAAPLRARRHLLLPGLHAGRRRRARNADHLRW